jgi:hypothetical protein
LEKRNNYSSSKNVPNNFWIIFILKKNYWEGGTIVFLSKIIPYYIWIIFILEQFYWEHGTIVLLSRKIVLEKGSLKYSHM